MECMLGDMTALTLVRDLETEEIRCQEIMQECIECDFEIADEFWLQCEVHVRFTTL